MPLDVQRCGEGNGARGVRRWAGRKALPDGEGFYASDQDGPEGASEEQGPTGALYERGPGGGLVDKLDLTGQGFSAGIYDDKSEIAATTLFVRDKYNLQE